MFLLSSSTDKSLNRFTFLERSDIDASHRDDDIVPGYRLLAGASLLGRVHVLVGVIVVDVVIVVVGLAQVALVDGLEGRRKHVRNVLLRP